MRTFCSSEEGFPFAQKLLYNICQDILKLAKLSFDLNHFNWDVSFICKIIFQIHGKYSPTWNFKHPQSYQDPSNSLGLFGKFT